MNPEDPFLQKDTMEPLLKTNRSDQQNAPLQENQFFRNEPVLKSLPFWFWIFFVAVLTLLGLGISSYYSGFIYKEKSREPFMEVTNRELSVFLWQFPNFLRSNVSKKTGYTPGFMFDRENFDPAKGDDFVTAPPDLIFLYHTWNRLLAPFWISRPISPKEFNEFLEQLSEWKPENWSKAPQNYAQLIESKSYEKESNLENLSLDSLPLVVRQAFIGWKNYFKEGDAINAIAPTIDEINQFLSKHPTYGRSYWRNIATIDNKEVAGLNYLLSMLTLNQESSEIINQETENLRGDQKIPSNQLSSFLRVAFYNGAHSQSSAE